jgi:hypothetical protein
MKTMILDVASPTEAMAEFVNTWKTKEAEPSARISFASPAVPSPRTRSGVHVKRLKLSEAGKVNKPIG